MHLNGKVLCVGVDINLVIVIFIIIGVNRRLISCNIICYMDNICLSWNNIHMSLLTIVLKKKKTGSKKKTLSVLSIMNRILTDLWTQYCHMKSSLCNIYVHVEFVFTLKSDWLIEMLFLDQQGCWGSKSLQALHCFGKSIAPFTQ